MISGPDDTRGRRCYPDRRHVRRHDYRYGTDPYR